jgi:hypothetical protein
MIYTRHVVAALLRIQEVPGSGIGPDTFCIDYKKYAILTVYATVVLLNQSPYMFRAPWVIFRW